MKLTVLVDNNTYIDQYYLGEPAVSYLIEDGNERILFDTGYSDILLKNAEKLSIDLSQITKIVFSHGHNDHTGGFEFLCRQFDLSKVELISHPDALKERRDGGESIGINMHEEEISIKCKLSYSKNPVSISKNLFFLGEVPAIFSFEERKKIGKKKVQTVFEDDYVLDDSALAYNSPNGIFIITGCSHSGICNIIEYAKKVCNKQKVLGVIGGFHLFKTGLRLNNTIQYFIDNNISELYPCHCVSFEVKAEINRFIPINEVGVGLSINL